MFRIQPNPTVGVDLVHKASKVIVKSRIPERDGNAVIVQAVETCPEPLRNSKDAYAVSLWAKRFMTVAAVLALSGCAKSCEDGPYHPDDHRPAPRQGAGTKW